MIKGVKSVIVLCVFKLASSPGPANSCTNTGRSYVQTSTVTDVQIAAVFFLHHMK